MIRGFCLLLLVYPLLLTGCGAKGDTGPKNLVEVKGVVKLNGVALADANVEFHTDGDAKEHYFGYGRTDGEGKFMIMVAEKPGLPPGNYKVVVSKKVIAPYATEATETISRTCSDPAATNLSATVEATPKSHEFNVSAL